jgi:hypothetical protein
VQGNFGAVPTTSTGIFLDTVMKTCYSIYVIPTLEIPWNQPLLEGGCSLNKEFDLKDEKIHEYFIVLCDLSATSTGLNTLKRWRSTDFDKELLSMIEEARIIIERAEKHAREKIQELSDKS